jgi:O-acetyl-ADP-ribose deacetylase (regulator of RNase III)
MLHFLKGDLLESNCGVIAHQANCFKTFGAGLAKQIKMVYPEAYTADINFPVPTKDRLGKISSVVARNGVLIFNLYGQYGVSRTVAKTNPVAFELAVTLMLFDLQSRNITSDVKVGLPFKIGCGLGGGDWVEIRNILARLSTLFGRDLYFYAKNC